MKAIHTTVLAAFVAGTLGLALAPADAAPRKHSAATRYDGLWGVLIVTQAGECERGVRISVQIVNGVVRYANEPGTPTVDVNGHVDHNGRVKVNLVRGNDSAEGTGRLGQMNGGGEWRAPSRHCVGTWTAERRG